jgi:SPP1 gp7 family putative phage head morphogenesis protein
MFSLPNAQKDLKKIMDTTAKQQMQREKRKVEQELGVAIEWDVTPQKVKEYIEPRIKVLKEIPNTTFKSVEDELAETIKTGIEENMTTAELAAELKTTIKDAFEISRMNVNTIARTEINSVNSWSRFDIFEEVGIEKHEWLTAQDEKVRLSHQQMNHAIVNVGDPFPVTGLRFPLDPEGAPSEVINCRCIVLPVQE